MAYSDESPVCQRNFAQSRHYTRCNLQRLLKLQITANFERSQLIFKELLSNSFEKNLFNVRIDNTRFLQIMRCFYLTALDRFIKDFEGSEGFREDLKQVLNNLGKILQGSDIFVELNEKLRNQLNAQVEGEDEIPQLKYEISFENVEELENVLGCFDLASLFHFCAQVFFVFVLPNPYFLEIGEPDSKRVVPKIQVLNKITLRKKFYFRQIEAAFPGLKVSTFFDIVFEKLQKFLESKLQHWKNFCPLDQYEQSITRFSRRDAQEHQFVNQPVENSNRNKSTSHETLFINGYLSNDKKSYLYFYECFNLFDHSKMSIVNWNNYDIKSILTLIWAISIVATLVGGIAMIPLIEFELILIGILGAGGAFTIGSILSHIFVPFKTAFSNAKKDGKKYFNQLVDECRINNRQMDFFCYSFGSVFVLNCLLKNRNRTRRLYVKNLVILGGVTCQSQLIDNINFFIGNKGIILGRIILVSSKNDFFNKIMISYFFQKRSLGYDQFDFIEAANRLMLQCSTFRRKGYNETVEYVRDKIIQVDASHLVDGHADYKYNFGSIACLIYDHLL